MNEIKCSYYFNVTVNLIKDPLLNSEFTKEFETQITNSQ